MIGLDCGLQNLRLSVARARPTTMSQRSLSPEKVCDTTLSFVLDLMASLGDISHEFRSFEKDWCNMVRKNDATSDATLSLISGSACIYIYILYIN